MRNHVINITLGPQFNQGKSAGILIFTLFLLLLDIFFYTYPIYIAAFLLSVFIILLVYNILDIQGVEIDKENSKVRNYKVRFWGKSGEWKDLNSFHSIYLDYSTYHVKTRSVFTELTTVKANYHSTELHGHFLIFLIHKNENKSLVLGEKSNYNETKKLAEKYSELTEIPLRDIIKEKVQKSKANKKIRIK